MAWYFNGVDQYQTIADDPALTIGDDVDYSGPFTFSLWLKTAGMADTGLHYLMSWGTSARVWCYVFGKNHATNAGKIGNVFIISPQTIIFIPEFNGWADDSWHNFALVGDGTTLRAYHDGIVCSTTASMATLDAIDASDDFYIGRVTGGSSYFSGHLAEMAKWDRSLLEPEIVGLAAGANPMRYRRDLRWYRPMRKDLRELLANLVCTNHGTTLSGHPRVELPPQTGIIQPIIQPLIQGA